MHVIVFVGVYILTMFWHFVLHFQCHFVLSILQQVDDLFMFEARGSNPVDGQDELSHHQGIRPDIYMRRKSSFTHRL
jgi:hypothetical protein